MSDRRLELGRIGRAHGLRGELLVHFTTNRSERAAVGARLFAGERVLVVVGSRQHGGRWYVHFEGVDDRSEATRLVGEVLTGDALGGDVLDEREMWAHELVGQTVEDWAGRRLGTVESVEANPAHDLLVLDGGALIPVVFVVDHGDGRVVVDIPEGLLE